jgi:hypothetical protein
MSAVIFLHRLAHVFDNLAILILCDIVLTLCVQILELLMIIDRIPIWFV